MPEVVVNTSPLQYLHQIGCLDLLPRLYRQVVVPEAVADDVLVARARAVVAKQLPGFDHGRVRVAY